ncbi:MAG: glycosyltransferase [Aquimonas sp.]|nr:glycosyltransferase [Aquimonas sp.]
MSWTVIIPAYGAREVLARCLESVIAHVAGNVTVYLADDASPGDPFKELVEHVGAQIGVRFQSVRRPRNLGFIGNVNAALADTTGDVVLLNSDAIVTPGWLDRLAGAFASDRRIATATPWSNNAEICSLPDFCRANPIPTDLHTWAHAASEAGPPLYPDLPTGVGFCMAIRRAALEQIGDFDQATFGRGYGEENDFCCRAEGHGWRNVLCDDAYVAHEGGVTFSAEGMQPGGENLARLVARYPDYNRRVAEFIMADPLRARREAVVARYQELSRRVDL